MKIILISLALIFSGCTLTPDKVFIKDKPYGFQKTTPPKPRNIRVYKEDQELYKAYIIKFREQLDFHNSQIDDYFKSKEDMDK